MSEPKSNPNILDIGPAKFEALGDRVLILEDEFRSGYECTTCSGHGKIKCPNCDGLGEVSHGGPNMRCHVCEGSKAISCPECGGKGGILVVPEVSQRRPTTGSVVSVGPECKSLSPGQGVMYSNFAGYVVDLARAGEPITLRILHETEVLCKVSGHLDLKTFKSKTEVALGGKI